jgi:hypothetical protein
MISDTPICDSTPHNVADLGMLCRRLERQLNETDRLAAVRLDYIKNLERELNAGIDRIKRLLAERDTARMQAEQKVSLREEFRELLGTDDVEHGVAVVRKIKRLAEARLAYIKQLEQENDAMRADLLLWNEKEVNL